MADDRLQVYQTDQVRVSYDPKLCIHSGICLRTLPAVFDIGWRQWVHPERATAEEVLSAVSKCPSHALKAQLVTSVHRVPDPPDPEPGA
jgi:uncharacterized Fe-S cluster protein YjdI